MSTRPTAPPPRGGGAQAEGEGRHTTLGIQETRSRGGRRRNVPAPSAVGDDKGQLIVSSLWPVGAGRLDAAPNRNATLSSKRPTPTNREAKEPSPAAGLRGGAGPARRGECEQDDTRRREAAVAMRTRVLRRARGHTRPGRRPRGLRRARNFR